MEQGILPDRWILDSEFGLTWKVEMVGSLPHADEIEMSGRRISMIVRYGISVDGELILSRRIVWPQLRTIPNNTHASLLVEYDLAETTPAIRVNNKPIAPERPLSFHLNGCLTIESLIDEKLKITRTIFPSPTLPVALESISIENSSGETIDLGIPPVNEVRTARGTKGVYLLEVFHNSPAGIQLEPRQSHQFTVMHLGRIANTPRPEVSPLAEEADRRAFAARMVGALRFECPDPILSRMFDFAKLRTAESIFETPKGLLHGPGGGAYYAAVWCNDQCEYANPFFPYLGDAAANQSALDSYRLYIPFMGPEYAPIPSSIIAEGVDIWEGAGDRGDAAMYAYGASRFALARADQTIAHELWPAIEWCLEYCRRKITPEGVVASDSDELEGRFSHGKTNLATSCLAYSGFRSAAALARELGLIEASQKYEVIANSLELAIDTYFGTNIDGFVTYRYHEGMESLRSWICLPLVMGLHARAEGTIAALLSPLLWTPDGLRTDENSTTFWDRSTLYALRGIFYAGETKKATDFFQAYSRRRLVGEHAPYPVEAHPEGNQRQLAAESALYCRVVTEGIFGITPIGFQSFKCVPKLPEEWERMALRSIHLAGGIYDLVVKRIKNEVHLEVWNGNTHMSDYVLPLTGEIEVELPL